MLADCDLKTGLLTASHRHLRRKLFRSSEDQLQGYIFLCTCAEGCLQETLLAAADNELSEGFLEFFYRESDRHCPHAKAAMELFSSPFWPYQTVLESPLLPSGIYILLDLLFYNTNNIFNTMTLFAYHMQRFTSLAQTDFIQRCHFPDFNLKSDFLYPDLGTFITFQPVLDHLAQIYTIL